MSFDLITYAVEQETEFHLWEMWLTMYPYMTKDKFITFNDFKDKSKNPRYSDKSYEEIEVEMDNIIHVHERQVR